MFSKACEYGIKSMIFIAQYSERESRVSLKEIAGEIKSPVAFTAKIMQILSREGLLDSSRGATGGFSLAKSAKKITLAQIVSAIDGDKVFTGCGLGLEQCNAIKPCPVHEKFAGIRDEISLMLHSTSLLELSEGVTKGLSFLTR
ncbi:MAG: Rrf2 family transcriptional regulator [Cyclobacteriaceae bacterium]|nr:Rrf2 family transcriptional regulator [Cyclobacteriaceae bacterium]